MFIRLDVLLLNLFLVVTTELKASKLEELLATEIFKDGHTYLKQLLKEIVVTRISNLNCLAIINDISFEDQFDYTFFIELGTVPYYKILVDESEDFQHPNFDSYNVLEEIRRHGCNAYIILISNGNKTFDLLRFGDDQRKLDTRAMYILPHDFRLFRSDVHYLWKKIVNVIFIRQHLSRHTWFELNTVPFPSPIRGILIPRRLEVWTPGRLPSGVNLFRQKTQDLFGQELRVVTFQHVPGTVKGIWSGYRGVEIQILQALSVAMNFRPIIYEAPNADLEQWGRCREENRTESSDVCESGNYTGLLGEIIAGQADVALGNLHYTPFHLDLVDLSVPYDTQCLTFLTPESHTDTSWKTLILPFKPVMWAAILVTFVLGGLMFHTLARFHSHVECVISNNTGEGLYLFAEMVNCILYTLGMLLLISLPKMPTGWSLRVLTGWWWLYCLLVVVAYRSSMTAILANPAPRVMIDSLEQLAARKHFEVAGWGEQPKHFFTTSLDDAGQKVGEKMLVTYNAEEAVARVTHGEFAYYESIHFLKYMAGSLKTNENFASDLGSYPLHIMRECAINMPISIGLQKNSPLKPAVDRSLQRIVEAGLVSKWLDDVMKFTKTDESEVSKALMNLRKLYGAIFALAVGYLLGIIVLLAEILHWKYVVRRDPDFDLYALHLLYKKPVKAFCATIKQSKKEKKIVKN